MKILKSVKQRFSEKSTWISLIPLVAGVIGVDISHEAVNIILCSITAVAGAVGIITPDKKDDKNVLKKSL
jgi:hypothetical protein